MQVWQYVTLMKRVLLIDCPGVVSASTDSEADIVLKGVVRAEKLQEPQARVQNPTLNSLLETDLLQEYIGALMARVRPEHLAKTCVHVIQCSSSCGH
jgi:nuclear GTP-binding protein